MADRRGPPVVFLGPSLPWAEARAALGGVAVELRPPAAQGDLFLAARRRPLAIGLVDGVFERAPAVWHKEVLWALAEGVHVLGAASMGALRAAELAPFGMVGVGAIWAAYARGDLDDDGEVAVVHGDADAGFRPLSEALVDVRATVEAAVIAGVVGVDVARQVVQAARALHYPERRYPAILDRAAEAAPGDEARRQLAALGAWLPSGRVAGKGRDALALLQAIRALVDAPPPPLEVPWRFHRTDAWIEAERRALRRASEEAPRAAAAPAGPASDDALVEELQIEGAWPALRRQALGRALAVAQAQAFGREPDATSLAIQAERFRVARGLVTPTAFADWVVAEGLAEDHLPAFFEGESQAAFAEALHLDEALVHLPDVLRAAGRHQALRERATRKRAFLRARGLEDPTLADLGLDEASLWAWLFGERLRGVVSGPAAAPLPFALAAGFPDVDALRRAALREYAYVTATAG